MDKTRVCNRCGEEKPLDWEHYGGKRRADGRVAYYRRTCKPCHNEQSRKAKAKKVEAEESLRVELGNPEWEEPRRDSIEVYAPPVTELELKVLEGASCKGRPEFASATQQKLDSDRELRHLVVGTCAVCPVVVECAEYGDYLELELQVRPDRICGVFGGEGPAKRRERRRRERRNADQAIYV